MLQLLFLATLSLSSMRSGPEGARSVGFTCEHGNAFALEIQGRIATVTTVAGRYALQRRPSSIGVRFATDAATLILDEDRASLNGLPGGPFRRCRLAAGRNGLDTATHMSAFDQTR